MTLKSAKAIDKYIQRTLIKKLRKDVSKFKMLTERDLEGKIIHYLSNEIDENKFLMSANKSIRNLTIYGRSENGRFLMPDIMIRDKENNNRIIILIEIKHQIDKTSCFLERDSDKKEIDMDCRKLNRFFIDPSLKKYLEHGYFIYLYRDNVVESKIRTYIKKKFRNNLLDKLNVIAINHHYDTKNKKLYLQDRRDSIDEDFLKLYDIDVKEQ
tara:strand:+ start:97 stop:732 length:636 start_codon:yes stop_codon:yes gene_type:complete